MMENSTTEKDSKPDTLSSQYFDTEQVRQLVIDIACASGISEQDSKIFADALIESDINGTSTHGVSRLNIYIRRIQKGLIDPTAEINIVHQHGATLVIDAANGLGQVQAVKTIDKLMPVAHKHGVAVCTIRNSQHFGALSYYCNKVAENDMILLATTNCEPSMAPTGSREAFFGTNPLACSFPTAKGYPVKIDLATSLVARGNIISAHKKNERIPEGWVLTDDGQSTTDPEVGLKGTMLPMAGHKGYALALMVEIFSGVLSGSAIGPKVGSMYNDLHRKQDVGHFFCLLDISAFMDVENFKQRIGKTIDEIKSCKRRPNVEEIRIPGEYSQQTAKRRQKSGIPIEEVTLEEIENLCEELNVQFNLG